MFTIDTPRSHVALHRVAIAAAAVGLTLVGGCGDTDRTDSSSSATGVAGLWPRARASHPVR